MFGGKWMDTFMDKLAQKLTAQEMIKANAAADAEEMKRLKNQLKEYQNILEQMQKLVADAADKLDHAKVDGDEINRLVAEGIVKISEMQADTEGLEQLQETLDELEEAITTKFESANENIHKECVKVYRNVQASVAEENEKQTEKIVATVDGLKGKQKAILGVSIAALIASVGSVVFQVLVYLHVI